MAIPKTRGPPRGSRNGKPTSAPSAATGGVAAASVAPTPGPPSRPSISFGSVAIQRPAMCGTCSAPTTATATPPGPSAFVASQHRCARISERSSPRAGAQAAKAAAARVSRAAGSDASATETTSSASRAAGRASAAFAGSTVAGSKSTSKAFARSEAPAGGADGRPSRPRASDATAATHRWSVHDTRRSTRCVCALSLAASWAAAACAAPRHVPWSAARPSPSNPPMSHHCADAKRASLASVEYESSAGSGRFTEPSLRTAPRSTSSQTGATRSSQSCSSTESGTAARMTSRTFGAAVGSMGRTPSTCTTEPFGLRSSA
mmetsp:Transcript_21533/g.64433  ORF Transcript_21533/g.64433 Transcript_21533/m.64433 type:complete len:319 (-) Transcript_21533:224-1180(-)